MIKIALFCDTPRTIMGGIVSYCNELKELLESSGKFKVTVFSNIQYKRCFNIFNLYSKIELKKNLKADDFDIIHINGFISTIPISIVSCIKELKINKPIVYTPHAHPFYALQHPQRNKLFFCLFVKPILKKVNKIISINKEDFQFFKLYNNSVITIPHWLKSLAQPKHFEKNLKKPMILFIGRNDDNKNLKVLYALPRDKYNVVCVTNKKPERDDFVFKYQIPHDELKSLYRESALTVIPSRYEAFSYVALESLCFGTPILISDRVRIVDFLDGVSGVTVYDYQNNTEFEEKVDSAMKKIVDTEKINEIFSAKKAFEQYSNMYINLAGENRSEKS